nr:DNA-3-methyladenine glycosylase [Rickettsiaceae bacterium]
MLKLDNDFYNKHAVEVAKNLLGKTLVLGKIKGIITETEAYRGTDDEASHAFSFTPRSSIMFGPSGY